MLLFKVLHLVSDEDIQSGARKTGPASRRPTWT